MENTIKILAVDDESYMLKILETCLPAPDFKLSTCQDAMSAMSIFKSGTFDLIMLDVVMPGIDGFELHSLIRNVNQDVPIIMLTAKVDDINDTMLKHISSDKNTYYQNKSFKKHELVERINQIVSEVRAAKNRQSYFEEMEKDITLAGVVQRSMFPHWDSLFTDSAQFCFYYRPYMKITGDVFSIINIAKDKYLAILGDISGHGIQAALCMSAIEYSLANFIRNTLPEDINPHNALNHLQAFISELSADRYMTCIIALVDFEKNEITYQNAGHPELIIYSPKSNKIIDSNPQKKGSLPIGMLRESKYKGDDDVTLSIPDDAIIFSYTDGLTDLQDAVKSTYSGNPIEEFVGTFAHDGLASSTVFKIVDALFKLGFDDINDDIALVGFSHHKVRENVYDMTIKPMVSEVDKFAQYISGLTAQKTGDETLAAKVEILLSEFLNNVVVHGLGNKNLSRPRISAHIEFRKEDILLTFCDKGKSWDMLSGTLEEETSADLLNYTRATSGRGLSLIKKITSSIRRSRYADILNETSFTVSYH